MLGTIPSMLGVSLLMFVANQSGRIWNCYGLWLSSGVGMQFAHADGFDWWRGLGE